MKNVRTKVARAGAMLLAATMCGAFLPKLFGTPQLRADGYEKTEENTTLGVSGISAPKRPESKDSPWTGSYVWYGHHYDYPLLFRVLAPKTTNYGGETLFLDSDQTISMPDFAYDKYKPYSNSWAQSDIRRILNVVFLGDEFLTSLEASAISQSVLEGGAERPAGTFVEHMYEPIVGVNDKVFLLDASEVSEPLYGYTTHPGVETESDWSYENKVVVGAANRYKHNKLKSGRAVTWCLRSASKASTAEVGVVDFEGQFESYQVARPNEFAPAFNVDLNKILFSTQVKAPDETGYEAEYKLTLLDKDITISRPSNLYIRRSGSLCTIPYVVNGSNRSNVDQVSILITDKDYNAEGAKILYYDKLNINGSIFSMATGTFEMPESITGDWGKDFHVYMVAEDLYGERETDYASTPSEICDPTPVYDVRTPMTTCVAKAELLYNMAAVGTIGAAAGTQSMDYDLDKDGNFDIHVDKSGSLPVISRLESTNIKVKYEMDLTNKGFNIFGMSYATFILGDYAISVDQVPGGMVTASKTSALENELITVTVSPEPGYKLEKLLLRFGDLDIVDITAEKAFNMPDQDVILTPVFVPDVAKVTGVKATAASISKINLSWDEVFNATGYEVFRSTTSDGPFTKLGTVSTNSRSCPGLSENTKYYFRVRAYQDENDTRYYGPYSDVIRCDTLLPKPAGVKAEESSATSATVSWNAVNGADGYQVWRSTSSTGTFTAVGSVTTTSRKCTGLTTGTTYYFKVRAYKEVDGKKVYGTYSSVVSVTPKPAAPSNVKAVSASATSVKVSWNTVSGATGYQVFRSTSETGSFTAIGSVTTTSRDCPGLTTGTTYYFKVRAYKEVNGTKVYGAYSSVVSAAPKPAAPTNVKATVSSATKVKVSWSAVSGATGYEVYRATSANGTYSKLGTVTTTSRDCPGLTTGTTYYFKVRAYKEVNGVKIYSAYSTVVSAVPKV